MLIFSSLSGSRSSTTAGYSSLRYRVISDRIFFARGLSRLCMREFVFSARCILFGWFYLVVGEGRYHVVFAFHVDTRAIGMVRCLCFGEHCKMRRMGICFLCAVLCEMWYFVTNCGSICVKFGKKSSEDWEANFVLPMEILLKRVGFIVLTSAGTNKFSIKKNNFTQNLKTGYSPETRQC